jgi:uncharacterized membrane protein YfcA
LGAFVLSLLDDATPLIIYNLFGATKEITLIKLCVGTLMILFAIWELVPYFSKFSFDKKWIPLGGLLSGFLGGFSGHQCAIRTTFLIKSGLKKEVFLATGIAIACLVDIARLGLYTKKYALNYESKQYILIFTASFCAILGAILGNRFLNKVSYKNIQTIVGIMLIIISFFLIVGLI